MESKYDDEMRCWEYKIDGVRIGLQIVETPKMPVWPQEGEHLFLIDTGYAGEMTDIVIPYELFEKLELKEINKELIQMSATTIEDKEIDFKCSASKIYIPKIKQRFNVIINTWEENKTAYLMGIGFLKRFKLLLDGPESKACILK